MTATLPTRTAMTTCAVPGRNHPSEDGLHLCRTHLDELGEWLHTVEIEAEHLDACPSMAANWNDSRGGRMASHQSPARVAPLVHLDPRRVPVVALSTLAGVDETLSVFDTLHGWANMIRDGRDIRMPGTWVTDRIPGRIGPFHDVCAHVSCRRLSWRHFVVPELTYTDERIFLSRHLEWAATQPWIGDLWAEIRKLRKQLQAANGTGELQVGACPECNGRLSMIEPHTSGSQAGASNLWAIECDRDVLHRWEGKQLIHLGVILEEQKR